MDYKIKGYQQFQGEFLNTSIKVSQKLVDLMSDEDQIYLRSICSKFESEMFNILKYYACIAIENEENNGETNKETREEIDFDDLTTKALTEEIQSIIDTGATKKKIS